MGESGLMKLVLISTLLVGLSLSFVSANEKTLKEVASIEIETEQVEVNLLTKTINFLWQSGQNSYTHVWPVISYGWYHVTCLSGHVTYLSLGLIGFSGTLSPVICKLKFLNSLELQDNNLSGELPKCLSSLVSLKTLDLSHNRFTGSIPSSWAHLPSLKHLDLSENELSGTIPLQLFSARTFK